MLESIKSNVSNNRQSHSSLVKVSQDTVNSQDICPYSILKHCKFKNEVGIYAAKSSETSNE